MDDAIQLKPFQNIIQNLFQKTLDMCVKSGTIKEDEIDYIKSILEEEGLTPENIEFECSKELKDLCLYEYEDVTKGSNRLNGKGYSSYKIEENMKIFLKEKLTKFATLLSIKKNLKPLSLKKSFFETLKEISDCKE